MSAGTNIKAGAAYVELFMQDNRLVRGLNGAQKKLKAFGESATHMGKKLLEASLVMGVPFALGVKAAADFEEEMANVSTMLDQPDKFMRAFKKGVTDMSVKFGEDTGTLAKGLYDILSASVPAEKALYVLGVSAKAAKAGVTDTGIAADAITTILNAYGLSASRAGDVSDWLFSVVKKGKTTFAELAPAVGMVATTAATAGVGMDEFGAAIATMTRNGVNTDNAVTALNAIITSFLSPSKEAADYARKLGFEMSSATIKSGGLLGVFQKISKLSPDDISTLFPNVRALRGVLPAIQNMKGFVEDIKVMQTRAGAADRAYKKMSKTLSLALARMKQAGIAIFVEIGEALSGSIKKISKTVVRYMGLIREWIAKNKEIVISALKIVGAIAAAGAALVVVGTICKSVAFVFGGISAVIAGVGTAISILITVIGAIISPIGLVVTAVAGLGIAILYYTGLGGKMLSWLGEKFQALKDFAMKSFEAIKNAMTAGDFTLAAKILWTSLQVAWQSGVNLLKTLWIEFKAWYQKTTSEIFFGALGIINDSWAGLRKEWVNTVSFLSGFWTEFTGTIIKTWNEVYGFLTKKWLDIIGMFDQSIDVEAAKAQVDLETSQKNKVQDDALANVESDRSNEIAKIEKQRRATEDFLGGMMSDDLRNQQQEYAEELAESQKKLEAARAEWKAAIEEAKSKKSESGNLKSGNGRSLNLGNLKDAMKGVATQLDVAKGKVDVAGSFYAASVRSLSAGNASERTAKAVEETAKNTKKTNQLLEKQSSSDEMVFE